MWQPGSVAVWSSRDREDTAGKSSGPPHRLYFHSSFRIRASPKVYWRGFTHGSGVVCYGQVSLNWQMLSFLLKLLMLSATCETPISFVVGTHWNDLTCLPVHADHSYFSIALYCRIGTWPGSYDCFGFIQRACTIHHFHGWDWQHRVSSYGVRQWQWG